MSNITNRSLWIMGLHVIYIFLIQFFAFSNFPIMNIISTVIKNSLYFLKESKIVCMFAEILVRKK